MPGCFDCADPDKDQCERSNKFCEEWTKLGHTPIQSNQPRVGNCLSIPRTSSSAGKNSLPLTEAQAPTRSNVDLTACVIWVSFVQLPGQPICFVGFASLPICQGRLVQRARSNSWIIVKQRDTLKSLASVIEIPALQLNLARQEDRKSTRLNQSRFDLVCRLPLDKK